MSSGRSTPEQLEQQRARTDFTLFDRVPLIRLSLESTETAYKRLNTLRLQFLECNIQSRDYIVFDRVLAELRDGTTTVRGVALAVKFFKYTRVAAPQLSSSSSTNSASTDVNRALSVNSPPFTPGSTTVTPRTPASELERRNQLEFEMDRAALKLTLDERTRRESQTLNILRLELLQRGRSPHVIVPFKYFSCTQFDERMLQWGTAGNSLRSAGRFFQERNASTPPKYYYLLTEFSDRGDLHQRLDPRAKPISVGESYSYAFQMTFALYQLQKRGMVHQDFHHGNITFKRNRAAWQVYYNVASGDTDERGALTHTFFAPFKKEQTSSESPDVVKIIDFELVRKAPVAITGAKTALLARAPEQLLASMRLINENTPASGIATLSFANDTFSLGVMLADMLLRTYSPLRNVRWSICLQDLPIDDEAYIRIATHVREFSDSAVRAKNQFKLPKWQAWTAKWTKDEPMLLNYIRNMIYLLGPPDAQDLPVQGQFSDFIWRELFSQVGPLLLGPRFQPQLRPFLEKHRVPSDAIDMLERVLRWSPDERATTRQMLRMPFFDPVRVTTTAADMTLNQFLQEDRRFDTVYVVFGDEPATQSRSRLQRRREQRERTPPATRHRPADNDNDDDDGTTTPQKRQKIAAVREEMATFVAVKTYEHRGDFEQFALFGESAPRVDDREPGEVLDGEQEENLDIPTISVETYEQLRRDPQTSQFVQQRYRLLRRLDLVEALGDEQSATATQTSTLLRLCAHCKRPSVAYRCKRCKKMYYCNTHCQRYHWDVHQFECGL